MNFANISLNIEKNQVLTFMSMFEITTMFFLNINDILIEQIIKKIKITFLFILMIQA
jgi:hypothetical protein